MAIHRPWRDARLALTLGILAAACLLGQAAAAEREPKWFIGSVDVRSGSTVDAWLALKPASGVSVTVNAPTGTYIAALTAPACDPSTLVDNRATWTGSIATGQLLHFCVRADASGSFRLVASASYPNGTSAGPNADYVQSDLIRVRNPYDLGTTGTTLLSAMVGFLFGVVTLVLQKQFDAKTDRDKTLRATESELAKAIGSEVSSNVTALEAFIAGNASTPAPTLQTSAYNAVSESALAFLGRKKREYLGRLESLNASTNQFNQQVRLGADRDALVSRARSVLDSVKKLSDGG